MAHDEIGRRPGRTLWVGDTNVALLTDLYQLTMAQAYRDEGMNEDAVFTLFSRRLPAHRNYLLAAGVGDALDLLTSLRFTAEAIEHLATDPHFRPDFLAWLRNFRFTGDVFAMPEGTPVFADEPLLEVVAPIAEAQIVETLLLNHIHFQTLAASKASRVVAAAAGRLVVDFGLRRMHGADAGLRSARAFWIAGVDATSNVLAGHLYGIPVRGTLAHSYIQAHDSELEAFRAFLRLYPDSVLLVDTYETLAGVEKVIRLSQEIGEGFSLRGVRLDSGDLADLARSTRRLLDQAGLRRVEIFASGGLDEYRIAELIGGGAPIDGFGVGTSMGVSADAPALDMVYKLVQYAGRGRLKTSPDKAVLPGRKQVFREEREGRAIRDRIGSGDEILPGRPLLRQVMSRGRPLPAAAESLDAARSRARDELGRLPEAVRGIEDAADYPVEVSARLRDLQQRLILSVHGQRT